MGGFYSRNEFGAWDSAMRVHWDDGFARSVGGPRAYDYGMLRLAKRLLVKKRAFDA